ncbi:hypothetical protein PR202_ga27142 [Eleusine coracana subsp. coracana]|uniref:J domain-containing protein n=1 Tax=Eleusine coracana subsp. coracana TaxID=191504 RepID=A0AAV5DGV1_ELECO|nr:hypothetical protein PR202_ga27142 [Eleusine coracana subsp. coracana]
MAATGQEEDDIDHYEVLCLPSGEEGAALTIEQIEKAYRTQSRLRHPDKRPDDPNATADFQSLSNSYKFLRDESLRRQFDARLRARREAAARAAAAGVKRRKAVSDLEERERAFAAGKPLDPSEAAKREDKRKAADVKRELDEFFKAKQASAAGAASTSHSAIHNHIIYNDSLVPLTVAPVQESGGFPARPTQTHESRSSNIDGTGFSDLEASVFRKLQEYQFFTDAYDIRENTGAAAVSANSCFPLPLLPFEMQVQYWRAQSVVNSSPRHVPSLVSLP